MYTNIIQKDGLGSVEWALHKYTNMRQEQIDFIIEGLEMAMNSNYFWHKGDHYIQTKAGYGGKIRPKCSEIIYEQMRGRKNSQYGKT